MGGFMYTTVSVGPGQMSCVLLDWGEGVDTGRGEEDGMVDWWTFFFARV
jgi:hypothetical protein